MENYTPEQWNDFVDQCLSLGDKDGAEMLIDVLEKLEKEAKTKLKNVDFKRACENADIREEAEKLLNIEAELRETLQNMLEPLEQRPEINSVDR